MMWHSQRQALKDLIPRDWTVPPAVRRDAHDLLVNSFGALLAERDKLADALRLVAMTNDTSLLDEAMDEDDLFAAQLVKLVSDLSGEYTAVLTDEGRRFVIEAVQKADPS